MLNLLSGLSGTSKNKSIEPREIFMSLPRRDNRYAYPRDVQSEVWKKWFEQREQKNVVIKMNTGSGKTVVGLMILQSCLNEEKGPAVYVVPDKYLAAQVCDEAKKLGVLAVTDRDDYDYTEHKAILVIPIHALVNGKSVFGMRTDSNYPIGSILLDDVHACLDTISSQFSLKISSSHELYNKMIGIFADSWKTYNSSYASIIESQDSGKNALLPFWIWQQKRDEIYRLLNQYNNDNKENKFVFFSLPLILDCLHFCNCTITSHSIEIAPKGIPISKITSFENATRRIFMSATLADDSVFVSSIGLKKDDITEIITPDKANDIGDRLMLFPKHLNSNISDDHIKEKVLSIARKHNVVVIVPSLQRGLFWDETGEQLVTKDNIEDFVSKLKTGHIGLAVFVNRYDGIDLPDNACRLLVIDGLPPLRSEYDKYVQSMNPTSNLLLREQIQKIEQGMGRGVRSNNDYCCIVFTGNKLADVLLRGRGVSYFSNATRAQYKISKELWGLLKQESPTPTIDEIFGLADYSFNREVMWIEKSKECLSTVVYEKSPNIDDITVALRKAFEDANIEQWKNAVGNIDIAIEKEHDEKTKGYLMQIKAEYTNFFDQSKAQEILKSARKFNSGTLPPIRGIQYEKLIKKGHQAKSVMSYIKELNVNPNEYIIHVHAVMDNLLFGPNADEFERAFQETGEMLGFASSRPEKETYGKGPDNLWDLGNDQYLVIECKTGGKVGTISKKYCNQLGGSVRWFEGEYGDDCQCVPVMIHQAIIVEAQATPPQSMRIISQTQLEHLKTQIGHFATALTQSDNWQDESKVTSLLKSYKLRGQDIVQKYTISFSSSQL